jgi:hypothetical protein
VVEPLVAGCEHDEVGSDPVATAHQHTVGDKLGDVGELHQPDLALDDEIGAADVEIIAAAAGQVLELPARAILAEIVPEADALQRVEEILVELLGLFSHADVALLCQLQRHRRGDEIAMLERRPFVIEGTGKLRARLDVDDQGGTALNQRDFGAAGVEVLCDVMAAVARADDGRALSAHVRRRRTRRNAGGATEARQCRDIRQVGDAAHLGGQHDVARAHLPRRAVGPAQDDGPAAFRFVI